MAANHAPEGLVTDLIPEEDIREKCGVVAVMATDPSLPVAEVTLAALYGVQHRGYDAAGILTANGEDMMLHKGHDTVADVFPSGVDMFQSTQGTHRIGMGHVRYDTTARGLSKEESYRAAMPYRTKQLAISHNGNIVNAYNVAFNAGVDTADMVSDSAAVAHTFDIRTAKYHDKHRAIDETLAELEGSYALAITDGEELIAARDPHGVRPLCIGRLPNDGGWIVVSETVALDKIGAMWVRDVLPGEILTIRQNGEIDSRFVRKEIKPAFCALEVPYLMSPASRIGKNRLTVEELRRIKLGGQLAIEHPIVSEPGLVVVGAPDSGVPAGIGYAAALGLPYEQIIEKRARAGRSFMQATQEARDDEAVGKMIIHRSMVRGKRLVIVDDSVIRGTQSRALDDHLMEAGALSVDWRIPFPKVVDTCDLGVAFSGKGELLAHRYNGDSESMAEAIGARSLAFISVEGFRSVMSEQLGNLCLKCVGGKPITPQIPTGRRQLPIAVTR